MSYLGVAYHFGLGGICILSDVIRMNVGECVAFDYAWIFFAF